MPNPTIVAIGAISAIVITSLVMGVDGWLVFSGCSLISGLGGFVLGKSRKP